MKIGKKKKINWSCNYPRKLCFHLRQFRRSVGAPSVDPPSICSSCWHQDAKTKDRSAFLLSCEDETNYLVKEKITCGIFEQKLYKIGAIEHTYYLANKYINIWKEALTLEEWCSQTNKITIGRNLTSLNKYSKWDQFGNYSFNCAGSTLFLN